VAAILFCTGASAQTAGTLTLVEGRLALIRGATLYTAAQGVRLGSGDILTIDPKGQAQVEFADGAILNLAQGARAMLGTSAGGRGQAEIVVLSGWVKFAQRKSAKSAPYRVLAPLAEIASGDGTAVLNTGNDLTDIFLESGAAKFSERGKKGPYGAVRDVKGGDFIVRRGEQPASFAPRPSAEFVKNMPRHFQDNLPTLLERVKGKRAEPKRVHEVAYAEVEAWLRASPPIRRTFVKRFEARAKDPEFRRKLIENLREHPEWDPVLFPEKYETKDSNDATSKAPGTQQ
jgi:hypothetical protein